METTTLKAQSHCVYSTHYHLVMATAQRRKVLTRRVLERFETLARERTEAWGGELLELRADLDHVHLHIELPPKVAVAEFTNALKTGTSRRLRSEFARLQGQKQLWSQSYCVIGGEGAPVEAIDEYLETQGRTDSSSARARPFGRRPLPRGELNGLSGAASEFLGSHPEEARRAITAGLEAAASRFDGGNGSGAKATSNAPAHTGNGRQSRGPKRTTGSRREGRASATADGDVVTVSQAAQRCGVSKPTIYAWIQRGALVPRKGHGRSLEIPVEQLAEQSKGPAAAPRRAPRATQRTSAAARR